jgi:hypothetical protein
MVDLRRNLIVQKFFKITLLIVLIAIMFTIFRKVPYTAKWELVTPIPGSLQWCVLV